MPYGLTAVDAAENADAGSLELMSVEGRAGILGAADVIELVTAVGAEVEIAGAAERVESTAVAPPLSHGFGGEGIVTVIKG